MTQEWSVTCKRCGKKLGYSDRAYRNSLQYGFSRPEYCEECQKDEGTMRKGMGSPYFHVPLVVGEIELGPLGRIDHGERVHLSTDNKGKFDETRFGLTQDKVREIADWFKDPNHRVVVVVGPTGSGKSTALPYWLVYPPVGIEKDFFTRDGQILVTQPRIVAVTGITEYLGTDLMGSSVGAGYDIGYSYSKEDKTDWRNAIEFVTDGKLVNWIVAGRISQYGIIVIDEAHERSENIETIMRLLKDRMGLYPNLKLIIASATIDAEFFRKYFDQEGAKAVEFEGKARVDANGNPVKHDEFFATDEEKITYEEPTTLGKTLLSAALGKCKWLVEEIVNAKSKDWGDILIFLHGKHAIDTLVENLKAWANQDENLSEIVEVYPLYRELEKEEKDKVLVKDPKPGKLRIVVSTNIAEASVTIDSIVYEIETGVEIQPQFKAEIGAIEYPLVLISKANASQRWGRTGRTRNGEVYCLYTKGQYDSLFLDYPVTAMRRSNLENVILTAKAAGTPNVSEGWLEKEIPKEEIDRSTNALVASNALSENKSLTSYGLTVRSFPYAPRLFDLLMAADDLGCSVEMATILPVIKNDGVKKLLSWKFNWDVYTKRLAYKRHHGLMAGCLDDVEFILKLFKAWNELPWLDRDQLSELKEEEVNSLRREWADQFFVNHKAMLKVAEERSQTLDRIMVGSKDQKSRNIDLLQINRVRDLLHKMLTEGEKQTITGQYHYTVATEPQQGSLATCNLIPTDNGNREKPESWLDFPSLEEISNGTFSRLFVDQVYPVGYRFEAQVENRDQEYVWIKTTRNLTRLANLRPKMEALVEDEIEYSLEDENEKVEDLKEAKGISLADIPIWYRSVNCQQAIIATDAPVEDKVIVEITGFDFKNGHPVVIATVVPQPEPFDIFAKRHRYSDEVVVEVSETLKFEGDFSAALVVYDLETNLEVLIESQDLSFARSSYVVTRIPEGTRLTLNIEYIDYETKRVKLTNWEEVENAISENFTTTEGNNESTVAKAKVVEIRTDGKVVLDLDMGQTSTDISIITSAYGNKLPKSASEFAIEEDVVVQAYRRSKNTSHTPLSSLPAKAVSKINNEERPNELSWKRGVLRFTGRMTYERLYELKTIADRSLEFHQALEKLYWYSNQLYVAKFMDNELYDHLQVKLAVGTVIDNAIVLEVNKGGVVVEVGRGITGFVPKSKLMGGVGNLSSQLAPSQVVQVRVLEHRMGKGQLLLEIIGGVDDPITEVKVGQTLEGIVESVNQYGIFVNIGSSITGRVRHKETFRTRHKTEDLIKSGETVFVKVLAVNQAERKVDLTMKIPENDPLRQLKVGESYEGTVVNLNQYGAFIELTPGADGLLRTQDFPKNSGFMGLGSPPRIEIGMTLVVRVVSIDNVRREISLAYLSHAK